MELILLATNKPDAPFMTSLNPTSTVYSVIWPRTREIVRKTMVEDVDAMMERHERATSKRQDDMHLAFRDAWLAFAQGHLKLDQGQFPEFYPCSGSSEGIREVLGMCRVSGKTMDLVVFDGEYEGYEALAEAAGTIIHRVGRKDWQDTLSAWQRDGVPWAGRRAQWWISQPSAIDGCVWEEYEQWLKAVEALNSVDVWVDLAYLGMVENLKVELNSPAIAGFVFSLSKVFGVYYRRIGGVFSKSPIPGLWGNRWFKSLDAMYLGERLLQDAGSAQEQARRVGEWAMAGRERFMETHGGAWKFAGINWVRSDVPLLVYAQDPHKILGMEPDHVMMLEWKMARRGRTNTASRRLCVSSMIDRFCTAN
jgi:hypothetical protein